ncbi:MAG: helix-turn-helix transcriptional regulator [Sphingobacteriia bacterium]|nr:helix-turn-helix transcriptional regulator [Sphingobacteriia bacterium]
MSKAKKIEDFNDSYNSDLIDGLFDNITPEEQTDTDYKMKLAAKIYGALKRKGWTQSQLAGSMDKQVSVISKWLSGTHNFTIDTLIAIQRILNVQLLDVEEYKEKKVLDVKLTISSETSHFSDTELHRYIQEAGGMSATSISKTPILESQW